MNPFFTYFNIADELDGGLTLDDLHSTLVDEARTFANSEALPWPPDLATAEEYLNDHREELNSVKCDFCGERVLPNQDLAEMYDPHSREHFPPVKVGHYSCGQAKGWDLA